MNICDALYTNRNGILLIPTTSPTLGSIKSESKEVSDDQLTKNCLMSLKLVMIPLCTTIKLLSSPEDCGREIN